MGTRNGSTLLIIHFNKEEPARRRGRTSFDTRRRG
jgi:hypothetical protein